jgi:hypothetical protein
MPEGDQRETDMTNAKMTEQVRNGRGFIAALDQSGGSTPKALKLYGVSESEYSGEEQMFDLIHAMRARIIKSPAFTGDKVVGAILFEQTMDRTIDGIPTATYLWEKRGVVPFLKIDKGLEAEADGVQLMKPMPGLDALLARAVEGGDLRDQGTVGHQCGQPPGDRGHRGAAVRARAAGRGAWADADPGAGSHHLDRRQGRGRGDPAGGDSEASGRA